MILPKCREKQGQNHETKTTVSHDWKKLEGTFYHPNSFWKSSLNRKPKTADSAIVRMAYDKHPWLVAIIDPRHHFLLSELTSPAPTKHPTNSVVFNLNFPQLKPVKHSLTQVLVIKNQLQIATNQTSGHFCREFDQTLQ